MAGTYNSTDGNKDAAPENNKASNKHFYVDLGVNYYYFNGPNTYLPASTGYTDDMPTASSNNPFDSYDAENWQVMPTLTIGYEFLSPDKNLQKIFGEQNAIEVKASYFHSSGSTTDSYASGTYINPWIITGGGAFLTGSSLLIDSTDWDYDDTYATIGVYYTGKKVVQHNLINSPYVGVSFNYLKQDSSYVSNMLSTGNNPFTSTGSDDLDSYYTGLEFGDKLTMPFKRQFSVYGKAGLGLYLMHTKLDASQLPREEPTGFQYLNETYNVTASEDQAAYKAVLETGVSYYFGKNNQNPLSPSLTLLAGAEYWSDVAYADNPTQANEQVSIAYDDSLNPYAGLQLHYPIA